MGRPVASATAILRRQRGEGRDEVSSKAWPAWNNLDARLALFRVV